MKILIFSLASSLNVITSWDLILAFVQFFSRNTWRIECKLDFECWLGKLVQVRDRSVEMLYGNTPFGPLSPHQPPIHTHCMWSHFHIHSLHSRGNLQMPITYQSTCLWNVGRNQSTRRNPTWNTGRICKLHTDSTRGSGSKPVSLVLWGSNSTMSYCTDQSQNNIHDTLLK